MAHQGQCQRRHQSVHRHHREHRRQRGVTLIMALIMLTLLTLLALTSFNLGKSNLDIVSNMQQRDEAIAAGQEVIEETISSTRFMHSPNDAIGQPCNGNSNTRCIDTNGDGVPDVSVALNPAPSCVKIQSIKVRALDVSSAEDAGCSLGVSQNFGVSGAVTGDSLCADSLWDIHAIATDAVSAARVEVTQGVSVRIASDDIATNCP
jgi:Tfp pilus assembly protein PilX